MNTITLPRRWNNMFSEKNAKVPKVLIIEQGETVTQLLTAGLPNAYKFYSASSIDDALLRIKEHGIHSIILDVASIGHEEGFLGIRRIKATNSNGRLPVIALLPEADPGMKTDSLLAGCTTFVVAPLSAESVDVVISEVLNLTAVYYQKSARAQAV